MIFSLEWKHSAHNLIRSAKGNSVAWEGQITTDTSIRMEWIVHIVYHSVPFGNTTNFIHTFHRHAHIVTACARIQACERRFYEWILSRFFAKRTKYRLTYIFAKCPCLFIVNARCIHSFLFYSMVQCIETRKQKRFHS